ncbi:MAG TPA: helicase-associated domain-containing protein, partial [Pseudonocardiaceae bacterium]|nr:helicase-associated domain-containing protein [Pseudonocardiaceae bacterium]
GHSADWLLTALADATTHGVPQPLEYLIRDVARRHGELTVHTVGCCVLADDSALLAEVAAQRGLVSLGLRLLAPGVLASAKPEAETLDLLRAHGYGPVAVTDDGTPMLTRIAPLRATPRARVMSRTPMRPVPAQPDPIDILDLAEELLAAGVTEVEDDESVAAVRKYGDHLSNRELMLLTDALQAETPVEITYLDQSDQSSRRVITPLELIGGMVAAWCHMRDDERHFLVSRIQRVDLPQRA